MCVNKCKLSWSGWEAVHLDRSCGRVTGTSGTATWYAWTQCSKCNFWWCPCCIHGVGIESHERECTGPLKGRSLQLPYIAPAAVVEEEQVEPEVPAQGEGNVDFFFLIITFQIIVPTWTHGIGPCWPSFFFNHHLPDYCPCLDSRDRMSFFFFFFNHHLPDYCPYLDSRDRTMLARHGSSATQIFCQCGRD